MNIGKKYVRHGAACVRPYLFGGLDLPDFVRRTFGAEEVERIEMGDGFHIEAKIGDSVVIMETGTFPPEVDVTRASVYVYVDNVDLVYQRALECGATPIAAPADKPYQERQAGVKDTFGNTWWISTYLGSRA